MATLPPDGEVINVMAAFEARSGLIEDTGARRVDCTRRHLREGEREGGRYSTNMNTGVLYHRM